MEKAETVPSVSEFTKYLYNHKRRDTLRMNNFLGRGYCVFVMRRMNKALGSNPLKKPILARMMIMIITIKQYNTGKYN